MNIVFVILAAGQGKRFGLSYNKLFYPLDNKPLIYFLIKKLHSLSRLNQIIITAQKKDIPYLRTLIKQYQFKKVISIVAGGKERINSVYHTLDWIKKNIPAKNLYIALHDGARFNVSEHLINRLIDNIKQYPGIIPVLKISDTIKTIKKSFVKNTIPRDNVYQVQTPQLFKFDILYTSYQKAMRDKFKATDDASILENYNIPIKTIEGEIKNSKLTYKEDIMSMLNKRFKVGIGWDIHAFTQNRPFILGGIKIKHTKGLAGHSDADALIHSLMDALLGAVGLRDIGHYFPDTNKNYKNIDSTILLKKVIQLIQEKNYFISNIDFMILLEKPKISPYIEKMKEKLSKIIDIDKSNISIKASTTEKLGFIGQEQGMAVQSIALLEYYS